LIHRAHTAVGQNTGEKYNYYEKQKQFEKKKELMGKYTASFFKQQRIQNIDGIMHCYKKGL
jgi:hypothetical protein